MAPLLASAIAASEAANASVAAAIPESGIQRGSKSLATIRPCSPYARTSPVALESCGLVDGQSMITSDR